MTNAEARFNNSLRPRKREGSLGRTAQDGHLDSHTAPELWLTVYCMDLNIHPWFITSRSVVRLPLSGTLGESVARSENTPCRKPSNARPTMVTALMPAFALAKSLRS